MSEAIEEAQPAGRLVWKVTLGSRLYGCFVRWIVVGVFVAVVALLLTAPLLGQMNRAEWIAGAILAAAIIAAIDAIVWYSKQVEQLEIGGNLGQNFRVKRSFGEPVDLPLEQIAAIVGLGNTSTNNGEMVWRRTLVLTETQRFRISLSTEEHIVLFTQLLRVSPFAWGFPFGGEVLPPAEVADRTHPNAPEKSLARLRKQIRQSMWLTILSGVAMLAILTAVIVVLIFAQGARVLKSVFWIFVFGFSGFNKFRNAAHLGRQLQQIEVVQQQLNQIA